MNRKKLVQAAMAGVLAVGLGASVNTAMAAKQGMEKCYGVVKAGKNDCGVPNKHSCAAQSKVDGDSQEWVYLPKGSCDKIVGGSTSAGKGK